MSFQSTPGNIDEAAGVYRLPREKWESQRLDDQHILFKRAQGYLINPSIAKALPSDATIADIACGTGIWLLDVAESYSKASLHAFDISDAQYPPADKRPANSHWHVADLRAPFPEEFHGRFDLVNVRLVCGVLSVDEWAPAVRNLTTLLKPGVGHLQWAEGNFTHAAIPLRGLPESKTAHLRSGFRVAEELGWSGPTLNAIAWLEPAMRESSLEDLELDTVATDRLPEMRDHCTRNVIGVVRGVIWRLAGGGAAAGVWSDEALDKLCADMESDMHTGAYITADLCIMTGRRP